jgi:hypothetical protein
MIESMNARLRKVTRNRGQFPSERAALKVLYLAVRNRRSGSAELATSDVVASANPGTACYHHVYLSRLGILLPSSFQAYRQPVILNWLQPRKSP